MSNVPTYLVYTFLLGFPFLSAAWLIRHFKASWRAFWIGVLVSILAGILHPLSLYGLSLLVNLGKLELSPPTNWLIFSIITGFLSAIFTESLRFVGLRWAKAGEKPSGTSLVLAVGSGGIGLIWSGLAGIITMAVMALIICSGPDGYSTHIPIINYDLHAKCSPSQPIVISNVEHLIASLIIIIQSFVSFTMHFPVSVIVWLSIRKRKISWFLIALLWHMLVIGTYVYISGFAYIPWILEKPSFPTNIIPIGASLLVVLNITITVWSYKQAIVVEQASIVPLDETQKIAT